MQLLNVDKLQQRASARWPGFFRVFNHLKPALLDLASNDVYVLASAIAFNALLSFFPFIILLMGVCLKVFHWRQGYETILSLLKEEYLPIGQEFIVRNLRALMAQSYTDVALISLVALIFTSAGIFTPIEMALNRAWKVGQQRSFWKSQVLAVGLVMGCGILALLSVYLAGTSQAALKQLFGSAAQWTLVGLFISLVLKVLIFPITVAIFFIIYYSLPNHPIPARRVLPVAIVTAFIWEVFRYLFIWSLPLWGFKILYGPFYITVTLVTWAFISSLILLLGANLAAQDVMAKVRQRHHAA